MGAPKAITATAHKLARIFYRLWTSGEHYTDPGIDAYEQQYQERMLKNLKKKGTYSGQMGCFQSHWGQSRDIT